MRIDVRDLTPLIQVFDMPTSLAFYRDILGFEVVAQSAPGDDFDWGLLKLGPATLMLNTAHERDARPSAPDPARRAAHADTGLFFFCSDVEETCRALRSRGIKTPAPATAAYGMKQLYVNDPDGYVLCFQQRASEGG